MVAITSVEKAEVKTTPNTKASSSNNNNNNNNKTMAKSNTRNNNNNNSRVSLVINNNDSINEMSFRKLPDETPSHIWNTNEAETHIQRMKFLDRKLAKYNDQIEQLKEMIRQEDDKCRVELERMEEKEQQARNDIAEFDKQSEEVVKETKYANMQYGQLKLKLDANTMKIQSLRNENKKVKKEQRRTEKHMDKLTYNTSKLEESTSNFYNSLSDLNASSIFDESCKSLRENVLDSKEEFQELKEAVTAMQARYMNEAEQRLEVQTAMARILYFIQGDCKDGKLANACTRVGIDVEQRSIMLMVELEAAEAARQADYY